MRRAGALALLAGTLLAFAAPTFASPPRQTTAHDIEGEVMCPVCGTLLELAESPQAKREKVYVARLVAAGRTKAEIKDALVAQYGPSVLALPKASGFDLSAYLVPIVAIVLAVIVLAFSVSRWRRDGRRSQPDEDAAPAPPQGEDADRLDADLGRYDL
jgi:cytochrome c-type biogenesis protein CcmH/NrfF